MSNLNPEQSENMFIPDTSVFVLLNLVIQMFGHFTLHVKV